MLFALLALPALALASQLILDRTDDDPGRAARLARLTPGSSGVIAQAFQWSWTSVARECAVLGEQGYAAVQVSPPQEHVQGEEWWTSYQPVSYQLESKLGSRKQFADMVEICHEAGVAVIVDAVLNHMTGRTAGNGTASTPFAHYSFSGLYDFDDFHHCGLEPNDEIRDWTSRIEVQTCELSGLADLDTESSHVRSVLAKYMADLLDLGIDGFRFDAAKHIDSLSLLAILKQLRLPFYSTAEVLAGTRSIPPSEYLTFGGDVHDARYTADLADVFGSRAGLTGLETLVKNEYLPSDHANIFVTNHDTERDPGKLSHRSPNNAEHLASVFTLAQPYGRPTILSSYRFDGFDSGAPTEGHGNCSDTRWLCQHRRMSNMVRFHETVHGSAMSSLSSPNPQRIAFHRQSKGFVAINAAGSPRPLRHAIGLPSGLYCDAASPTSGCQGALQVAGGQLTVDIPAHSAIALHIGALSAHDPTAAVHTTTLMVSVFAETAFGKVIYIVGDIAELGAWTPENGILLSATSYPHWTANITLPSAAKVAYKYVKQMPDDSFEWEDGSDRELQLDESESCSVHDTWR